MSDIPDWLLAPPASNGFTHESPVNASVEWYTPDWVFQALGLRFDLDPCHPAERLPWVPVDKTYCLYDNGLVQHWFGRVWLNPPYGKETPRWLEKMAAHGNGIALVFARTDTAWFHEAAKTFDAVCFTSGRIRFTDENGKQGGSPGAGSMLIAWGAECVKALELSGLGLVMRVSR